MSKSIRLPSGRILDIGVRSSDPKPQPEPEPDPIDEEETETSNHD